VTQRDAIDRGWESLEEEDPEEALDLADGILSGDSGDLEALHLAGCALMDMGRFEEAEERLRRAVKIDPEWGPTRESLAALLYRACRFDEGLAEIDRVVQREPQQASSRYLRGLLLDLLGRHEEADQSFLRASRIDPEACPRPASMDRAAFESVVEQALEALPARFREPLGNVPILVEEVPTRGILETLEPPSPDLLGLFVGVPLPQQSSGDLPTHPNAIYLFKRSLERLCPDRESLLEEIRITLLHEIGHYLGMEEDELDDAGYS